MKLIDGRCYTHQGQKLMTLFNMYISNPNDLTLQQNIITNISKLDLELAEIIDSTIDDGR